MSPSVLLESVLGTLNRWERTELVSDEADADFLEAVRRLVGTPEPERNTPLEVEVMLLKEGARRWRQMAVQVGVSEGEAEPESVLKVVEALRSLAERLRDQWESAKAEAAQIPEGLHPYTANTLRRFANVLAEKLRQSEIKYGYSDGWATQDWQETCQRELLEHIGKGDPRDVAIYAMFMWHRGWQTTLEPLLDGHKTELFMRDREITELRQRINQLESEAALYTQPGVKQNPTPEQKDKAQALKKTTRRPRGAKTDKEEKPRASLSWTVKPWPEEELDRLASLLEQAPPQTPGRGGHFARFNFLAKAMGCHVREIGAGLKLLQGKRFDESVQDRSFDPQQEPESQPSAAPENLPDAPAWKQTLAEKLPPLESNPIQAVTPTPKVQAVIDRAAAQRGGPVAQKPKPDLRSEEEKLFDGLAEKYPRLRSLRSDVVYVQNDNIWVRRRVLNEVVGELERAAWLAKSDRAFATEFLIELSKAGAA